MSFLSRHYKYYLLSFVKHDFRASITVFFVALPLCLGISLASNAPVYSGIAAGIVGGLVVTLVSKSELSVSGPAAGLTAICATAITELGALEIFFLSIAAAGFLQLLLGVFKLGGFTHFIPSAVIKGMLAAIGIILISKQIPLVIGYEKPDFWKGELFNIITFNHSIENIDTLYHSSSFASVTIAVISLSTLILWKRTMSKRIPFIPASFIAVFTGIMAAVFFKNSSFPFSLKPSQYVNVPDGVLSHIKIADVNLLFCNAVLWKNAVVICFVATLETLLSVAAIDKLDPYNRITPPNRELIAQGTGNMISGFIGGLPLTAVIVRSSANAEAGAKTKLSAFAHGIWLFLAILFAIPLINMIPYCVLAVILIRTGYNLAKPKMIYAVYKQGREQFLPFIITVIAILFTDLLIGVLIGIVYAVYFLVKHTYRAGFVIKEKADGHTKHFIIELALNVSFLNKKRFMELLDKLPEYSVVEINGADSVYIDRDILEIIQEFRTKAHRKHIQLTLINIPEVEIIGLH